MIPSRVPAAPVEPQRTVAVVRGAGPAELADRLHDEMTTLGWSVVELTPPAPTDGRPVDIRAVTEAISGSAGVLVRQNDVVLWIQSATGAGTAIEETVALAVDADASLAAMQLVELLRARLIAAGFTLQASGRRANAGPPSDAPPPRTAPPSSPPPQGRAHPPERDSPRGRAAPARPPSTRRNGVEAWVGASVGIAPSRGGIPVAPVAGLRAWLLPTGRLAFAAEVTTALVASAVAQGDAEAGVRPALALVSAEYVAMERERVGRLVFGAAAGLALLRVSGSAPPPDEVTSTWIPVAALAGRARYRHPLSAGFVVTADALIGLAAPRPVVRFYDDVAATWGRPFGLLTVGAEGQVL